MYILNHFTDIKNDESRLQCLLKLKKQCTIYQYKKILFLPPKHC